MSTLPMSKAILVFAFKSASQRMGLLTMSIDFTIFVFAFELQSRQVPKYAVAIPNAINVLS